VRRLAVTFTLTASLSVIIALVVVTLEPGAWSLSSIGLIATGALMSTLVLVTGFLLVQAPWARWGLIAVTAGAMVMSTAVATVGSTLVLVLGGVTIVGLAGPWLRFWVRQHPVPDALSPVVLTLMATAPAAPLVIGVGSYDTSSVVQWIASAAIVAGSFAYSRGFPGAVWLMRVVVPLAAGAAVVVSPFPHAIVIIVGGMIVTVLAWLPAARHASAIPAPVLPAPRQPREASDAGE
jgi:hypothetical protein